jgi:hypothetical protein
VSLDLWISVALAIPLAIAANVVTPRVQRWMDSRLSKGRERKTAKQSKRRKEQLLSLQKEYEEVSSLYENPSKLTHHYLDALLWVAFFGAFGSIYGAIFSVFGELGQWQGTWGVVGRMGAQTIALLTAMLIFAKSSKAIRIARRCRDFDSYSKKTKALIVELSSNGT